VVSIGCSCALAHLAELPELQLSVRLSSAAYRLAVNLMHSIALREHVGASFMHQAEMVMLIWASLTVFA
jgi:hypothetical protein